MALERIRAWIRGNRLVVIIIGEAKDMGKPIIEQIQVEGTPMVRAYARILMGTSLEIMDDKKGADAKI